MKRIFAIIIALTALLIGAYAQAPGISPFSADMKVNHSGGSSTGKIFFDAGHMRMEMTEQGHNVIMITDSKTQVSDMVMPQQKMYMEFRGKSMMGRRMPDVHSFDSSNPCASEPGSSCKKLGTETVNGRVCDKWQFSHNGGETTTYWIDQKLHFPIKSVNSDGSGMEFSNIKEGAQDPALFQPPAGYRKMDMSGMMGGGPPPHD